MKKLLFSIFILLISLSFYGQNDTIAKKGIIAVDKLNIVYRGMQNPLTIVVPNSKSFSATGPGLTKISEGKYTLTPGSGIEVTISLDIIANDNTRIKEEHIFRILNIKMYATINGQNCEKCIVQLSKKELKEAKLTIYLEPSNDFFQVGKFIVKFSDSNIEVVGNKINSEVYSVIEKLEVGSIFTIDEIHYDKHFHGLIFNPKPIKVMIVDEEN